DGTLATLPIQFGQATQTDLVTVDVTTGDIRWRLPGIAPAVEPTDATTGTWSSYFAFDGGLYSIDVVQQPITATDDSGGTATVTAWH
ncbi:MAG: hypothetical protein FWF28_10990, partial [Micrococcales bacterium]|nr:hypothetical protein [Micrococcales bacterium]